MRERDLCTIFKLYSVHESFLSAGGGARSFDESDCEPIFLLLDLSLSSGSGVWCGPIVESLQSFSVTSTLLRMR